MTFAEFLALLRSPRIDLPIYHRHLDEDGCDACARVRPLRELSQYDCGDGMVGFVCREGCNA